MDAEKLADLISKLNDASKSAEQFGPFYFALFLLLFVPLIAATFIKRSADKAVDPKTRQIILSNYSEYFRICMYIGAFCTLSGVGWWFYQSYRQAALIDSSIISLTSQVNELKIRELSMRYTTIGYIENATPLKNEFLNTLGRPSVVFSREGAPGNTWIFAVISDQPIEELKPISVILEYVSSDGDRVFWNLDLPIHASPTPIAYRLTIDQDGAHIVQRR